MLHPSQFIRTSAGHAMLLLRPIRRPRDVGRLRALLQSEAYGVLLRVEAASEEARDAPRPNDDDAAAATGRTAMTSKHALALEGLSQKSAPPVAKIVAKRGGRVPGETFDLIKFDAKGRPTDGADEWRCELRRPTREDAK